MKVYELVHLLQANSASANTEVIFVNPSGVEGEISTYSHDAARNQLKIVMQRKNEDEHS